jgi:hypothetical protein
MNKFLDYRREEVTSNVEKSIGLVIFREEIASFMMPLKDRWRKWREYKEEEHNSLMIWEIEELKEEAEDRERWKQQFITHA